MLQRVMSRLSVEIFSSHSTGKICRETLLCCVSEKFQWRKSLWVREGGSIKNFHRKTFVSQCPKFRRGTHLCCVSQSFWKRKSFGIRGRESIKSFRGKFFISQCQKLCRETLLRFRKCQDSKSFMPKRGISRFSIDPRVP